MNGATARRSRTPDRTPVDTTYADHRFRSRLEARWAVFYDVLGWTWTYESETYEVGARGRRRRYLPDFHLPAHDAWVEVKGDDARLDPGLIAAAIHPEVGLPNATGGLLILGDIPRQTNDDVPWHQLATIETREAVCHDHTGSARAYVAAKTCVKFNKHHELEPVTPTWFVGDYGDDGRFHVPTSADRWSSRVMSLAGIGRGLAERDWDDLHSSVDVAYQAASRARFEHGEGRCRYAQGELR